MPDLVSITSLTASELVRPMHVEYAVRFDPRLLRVATRALGQPATSIGGAPVLSEAPTQVNRTYAGADGNQWFVPMVTLPMKSKTSSTPAVFIAKEPERWALEVTLDLRRHAAVPETAMPLPLSDLTLTLTSSALASPVVFETVADLPAPDASVLRRVFASTPVDHNRVATAMQTDPAASFSITASVHYADPAPAADTEPDAGVRVVRDHRKLGIGLRAASMARLRTVDRSMMTAQAIDPNLEIASAISITDMVRLDPELFRFPRAEPPAQNEPTARTVVAQLADGGVIPASFPPSTPAYRSIYAMVGSAFGVDPDSAWRMSPAGPWKDSGIPGRYHLLPTEYRLAFDVEQQLPAVNVVLVEQPVADGAPAGSGYKVRVRFKVVPWVDPDALEALRSTIVAVEGVTFPVFEVGGDDGATFHSTALLQDLGGGSVTAGDGGLAVDSRGFEYVVEGTVEYYTLLTKLLAPASGAAPGLDGHVRCTLKAAADDPAPQLRDVPVRLRLDRPATDLLSARLLPLPPIEQWPADWSPPLFAAISSSTTLPVVVSSLHATLLLVDPDIRGLVIEAIPAVSDPAALTFAIPERPPAAPRLDAAPTAPSYPTEALAATDGVARPEIEKLQDRLADLGHAVPVTGVLGEETAAGVTAFQTASGLPATGTVDEVTWGTLFVSAVPPPPAVEPGEVLIELTPTTPVVLLAAAMVPATWVPCPQSSAFQPDG